MLCYGRWKEKAPSHFGHAKKTLSFSCLSFQQLIFEKGSSLICRIEESQKEKRGLQKIRRGVNFIQHLPSYMPDCPRKLKTHLHWLTLTPSFAYSFWNTLGTSRRFQSLSPLRSTPSQSASWKSRGRGSPPPRSGGTITLPATRPSELLHLSGSCHNACGGRSEY